METGGFCSKKDGTSTDCECPESRAFVEGKGCRGKTVFKVPFQQFSEVDCLVNYYFIRLLHPIENARYRRTKLYGIISVFKRCLTACRYPKFIPNAFTCIHIKNHSTI